MNYKSSRGCYANHKGCLAPSSTYLVTALTEVQDIVVRLQKPLVDDSNFPIARHTHTKKDSSVHNCT